MLRQKVGKLVIVGATKLFNVTNVAQRSYIDADKTVKAAEHEAYPFVNTSSCFGERGERLIP